MKVPVRGIRMHASCALDLCYIAAGELSAYIEQGPWPWDTAAGMCIFYAVQVFSFGDIHRLLFRICDFVGSWRLHLQL